MFFPPFPSLRASIQIKFQTKRSRWKLLNERYFLSSFLLLLLLLLASTEFGRDWTRLNVSRRNEILISATLVSLLLLGVIQRSGGKERIS